MFQIAKELASESRNEERLRHTVDEVFLVILAVGDADMTMCIARFVFK